MKNIFKRPETLIGVGIGGFISAAVMAGKASIKANQIIDDIEYYENEDLSLSEKVKATWKCYIPTAIVIAGSTYAILMGTNILNKKNASLMASAGALAETLNLYSDKVKEVVGEEKADEIRKEVTKERVARKSAGPKLYSNNDDDILCFDNISGTYFISNMAKLKDIEHELNKRMLNENYVLLNEYYEEIGLDSCYIGSVMGWHIDRGFIDLDFDSMVTKDGKLALVVDHNVLPVMI